MGSSSHGLPSGGLNHLGPLKGLNDSAPLRKSNDSTGFRRSLDPQIRDSNDVSCNCNVISACLSIYIVRNLFPFIY